MGKLITPPKNQGCAYVQMESLKSNNVMTFAICPPVSLKEGDLLFDRRTGISAHVSSICGEYIIETENHVTHETELVDRRYFYKLAYFTPHFN